MDHRASPTPGPPREGAAGGAASGGGRPVDGTEEQIAREAEEQVAREIAREQEYADLLYARVDELITHVERNLDRVTVVVAILWVIAIVVVGLMVRFG